MFCYVSYIKGVIANFVQKILNKEPALVVAKGSVSRTV